MKNTIRLAALFTILASTTPAQAGWQDTIEDIFPSPTVPEKPDTRGERMSGLAEIYQNAKKTIKRGGVSYKGGTLGIKKVDGGGAVTFKVSL